MTIRVLLADDHVLLRAGLRALLQTGSQLEVVGEAADGDEVVQKARQLNPDVVVMDLSMPGCGGIEATRMLTQAVPGVRVLILTLHEDSSLLQEALRAGASGYILKRALESELVNAIQAVNRGDMYVHPAMTRALFFDETAKSAAETDSLDPLTPREVEVVQLLANGYTNRQIADLLAISVRTVESHRSNVMNKLDLHSRSDLVRYAARNGLLNIEV